MGIDCERCTNYCPDHICEKELLTCFFDGKEKEYPDNSGCRIDIDRCFDCCHYYNSRYEERE